eukprot:6565224-Prymnesium_polylepis.1
MQPSGVLCRAGRGGGRFDGAAVVALGAALARLALEVRLLAFVMLEGRQLPAAHRHACVVLLHKPAQELVHLWGNRGR